MSEYLKRRSRYIVPFRFGGEERSKRDYIRFLERRTDRYHGHWIEDTVQAGEQDLYGYILNSFNDRGKFSPGNIGAVYRYEKNDGSDEPLISLKFHKEGERGLSCSFDVVNAGMALFVTGVGFFWYETGSVTKDDGKPLTPDEDMRFQMRFKELNLERNIGVIKRADSDDEFTMGEWIAEIVTGACPGAGFFASRPNILNNDGRHPETVPDKSLLFQYAVFDRTLTDLNAARNYAYHLTEGYDIRHKMPVDANFKSPFENVIWYASKAGAGCFACAEKDDLHFFLDIMPDCYMRNYFLLYIIALNEQYTTLLFAERMSDELPADPQCYLSSELYLDIAGDQAPNDLELLELERKITRLTTEINVFFAKNTRLTVSFIEHQDKFYRYLIEELCVREDTRHLMNGLAALQDLMNEIVTREERINHEEVSSWRKESAYKKLETEKEILRKELYQDAATGLYNKKGLMYFGRKLYSDAVEQGKSLFVCVCDMNGLKYINDTFGHDDGDIAISGIADILRESILEGDYAFRQGGDEFLVLGLREHDSNEVKEFSERVEDAMQRYQEARNDDRYSVALCYGPLLCDVSRTDKTIEDLISISDEMMYEMKKVRDQHRRD